MVGPCLEPVQQSTTGTDTSASSHPHCSGRRVVLSMDQMWGTRQINVASIGRGLNQREINTGFSNAIQNLRRAGTLQEQLQWRLAHWLESGSKLVEPLLREVSVPVLVLAGSEDHMLPSATEAARLSDLIPTCQQVRANSHLEADVSILCRWPHNTMRFA